jgi:hypothetical protein
MKILHFFGFLLFLAATRCPAAPFGFEYGMTESQIVHLVGKAHVLNEKQGELTLNTAPRPYWLFHYYALEFSPSGKLTSVVAVVPNLLVKSPEEMRNLFDRVKGDVIAIYAEPDFTLDCTIAPQTDAQKDGCAGASQGRPSLFANWEYGDMIEKSHLERIHLSIVTDSKDPEVAALAIVYSYVGAKALEREQQKQQSPF